MTTITIADQAINTTYESVSGTASDAGTGALFDVTKTNGVYTVVVADSGADYVAGETITIAGSDLGGEDTDNDLIITVGTVGAGGVIATFGSVGEGRVGDGVVDVIIAETGDADAIDTYTFLGDSADYTITKTDAGITVDSDLVTSVTFDLADYDRVVFDDTAFAFDVDGAAGTVYSILAAGLGIDNITAEYMGIGLDLVEQGWTDEQLAAALVGTEDFRTAAGGSGSEAFVGLVYENVFGTAATLEEIETFAGLIDNGTYSKAELLLLGTQVEDFQTTIDLVGLADVGIEYTLA